MSNTVQEGVAEATQEFVALVQVDVKAKMDILDGQLKDLKSAIIMNRDQIKETAEIFSRGNSDIVSKLADIKKEIVKINEGTEIPLSQNVPREVCITESNGDVFDFQYCLKYSKH